ncbi:hypothetical protein N431DRAFT_448096 [Stipitochalara longipes BDJ]|nr:hypothetical protein N431DRAFT_448096 [Stipitochalara longipes BDJ]
MPYSWVPCASKLGCPTFSFGRLGNSGSDYPNFTTTVQYSAQAAIIHELVKLARAGAPRFPFSNFVEVACSNDFNSAIIGGFSKLWASYVPDTGDFRVYFQPFNLSI